VEEGRKGKRKRGVEDERFLTRTTRKEGNQFCKRRRWENRKKRKRREGKNKEYQAPEKGTKYDRD